MSYKSRYATVRRVCQTCLILALSLCKISAATAWEGDKSVIVMAGYAAMDQSNSIRPGARLGLGFRWDFWDFGSMDTVAGYSLVFARKSYIHLPEISLAYRVYLDVTQWIPSAGVIASSAISYQDSDTRLLFGVGFEGCLQIRSWREKSFGACAAKMWYPEQNFYSTFWFVVRFDAFIPYFFEQE